MTNPLILQYDTPTPMLKNYTRLKLIRNPVMEIRLLLSFLTGSLFVFLINTSAQAFFNPGWIWSSPEIKANCPIEEFAVSRTGEVFTASQSCIMGFSSKGELNWIRRISTTLPQIQVDSQGIVVVKLSDGVAKLDPTTGETIWKKTYERSSALHFELGNKDQLVIAPDIAPSLNSKSRNIFIDFLDSAGSLTWSQQIERPETLSYYSRALLLGPDNSVYVNLRMGDPIESKGIITRKYSAEGKLVWSHAQALLDSKEFPVDSKVDSSGNFLMLSQAFVPSSNKPQATLVKYSFDGILLWKRKYDFFSPTSLLLSLQMDTDGDPFLIFDAGILRLNPAGDVIWTQVVPNNTLIEEALISPTDGLYVIQGAENQGLDLKLYDTDGDQKAESSLMPVRFGGGSASHLRMDSNSVFLYLSGQAHLKEDPSYPCGIHGKSICYPERPFLLQVQAK